MSLSKELYRKLLNLEDEEGKTTSGIISEILEVFLNNNIYQKLHKMKTEGNVDFVEILRDIFQKGLEK
ncbi:MAG: hypothetical protein KJI71_00375 [Patescibacteria group bacterium]|nr:hypothetical protein [Patescibacteria group bacterium]